MDKSIIRFWSLTDPGMVRENNEDYFGFFVPDRKQQKAGSGSMFITVDGIGGYDNGEVASKMVVDSFTDCFKRNPGSYDRESVTRMMEITNTKIYQYALSTESKKAGAAMSALILKGDRAVAVNSGDCRVYRIRKGKIEQLSKDHSLVQQMIDTGQIDKGQAREQSFKNLITSAMGVDEKITFEYNRTILKNGDRFVLCSDGLHGLVSDEEILEIAKSAEPSKATASLVELANQRGGNDNITVQVVHYDRLPKHGATFIFGLLLISIIIGMIILLGPMGEKISIDGKPLPWITGKPATIPEESPPRVSFPQDTQAQMISIFLIEKNDFDQENIPVADIHMPGGISILLPREGEYLFKFHRDGYLPQSRKQQLTDRIDVLVSCQTPWHSEPCRSKSTPGPPLP